MISKSVLLQCLQSQLNISPRLVLVIKARLLGLETPGTGAALVPVLGFGEPLVLV